MTTRKIPTVENTPTIKFGENADWDSVAFVLGSMFADFNVTLVLTVGVSIDCKIVDYEYRGVFDVPVLLVDNFTELAEVPVDIIKEVIYQ